MKAKDILAISIEQPELLFNRLKVKSEYRSFARIWHPDVNSHKLASEVFSHIGLLYSSALKKKANKTWEIPGIKEFYSIDGKTYRIKYHYSYKYELGYVYVTDKAIVYTVHKKHDILYIKGSLIMKSFQYADNIMEKEISKFLPTIKKEFRTKEYNVIVLKKTVDLVPLRCLLTYYKGSIPPKHVAWMISRLHNLMCYFKWLKITHNDISIDNCLVSIKHHTIVLTGGWWYSMEVGSKLTQVTSRTFGFMNPKMRKNKKATSKLDSELMKSVGRELLGDESGTRLLMRKKVPSVIANWLLLPHSGNAFKDFDTWQNVILTKAWGKRKFLKLDIPIKDIYNSRNGG